MQQTDAKEIQDKAWLGGKSDSWGIVQEIKIWSYIWYMYKSDVLENETDKIL